MCRRKLMSCYTKTYSYMQTKRDWVFNIIGTASFNYMFSFIFDEARYV